MKITRLNHAAINVDGKWEETRAFYTGLLGMGTSPRPDFIEKALPGCWLQFPNAQVHVIDAPLSGRAGEPIGPHVSYYVDDLGAAEQELADAGVELTAAMGEGPARVIWCTDPAGNTVELQQDPDL
jgi:catechol 2,3-dioxygenase-like lactoylglutathione lyase family enzyme